MHLSLNSCEDQFNYCNCGCFYIPRQIFVTLFLVVRSFVRLQFFHVWNRDGSRLSHCIKYILKSTSVYFLTGMNKYRHVINQKTSHRICHSATRGSKKIETDEQAISTKSKLLYLCPTFIDPDQWLGVKVTLALSSELPSSGTPVYLPTHQVDFIGIF